VWENRDRTLPYECQESCFKNEDYGLFENEIDYPSGYKSKLLTDAVLLQENLSQTHAINYFLRYQLNL